MSLKDDRTRLSDPPPYQRIRPNQIDNIGEAVLAVARELWVLTDRVAVLEAVLEKHGLTAPEEIDRFQPDEALCARLKERRDGLVQTVERALRGL
jgi:hypothetical protein